MINDGFSTLAKKYQRRKLSFKRNDSIQFMNQSNVIEQLKNFLEKFEIEKGFLSITARRQIHKDFLDHVQYYRPENYQLQTIAFAQNLADHAYKTPEGKQV